MFNDKELIKQIKDLRTGSPDFEFDTSTQQIIAAVRVHDKLADEAETGALLFKRLRAQLAAAQKRIEELEKGGTEVSLLCYQSRAGRQIVIVDQDTFPDFKLHSYHSARIILDPEERSTK